VRNAIGVEEGSGHAFDRWNHQLGCVVWQLDDGIGLEFVQRTDLV